MMHNLIRADYSQPIKQKVTGWWRYLNVEVRILVNRKFGDGTASSVKLDGEHFAEMLEAAQNVDTAPKVLEKLSHSSSYPVVCSVAGNPTTSLHVLNDLYNRYSRYGDDVRVIVASNESCSKQMLEVYAGDSNWLVRRKVAEHVNTPHHVIQKLCEDSIPMILESIASRGDVPQETLEYLSGSSFVNIRCAVALNPNTSTTILFKLASDTEPWVLDSINLNPNCPQWVKDLATLVK